MSSSSIPSFISPIPTALDLQEEINQIHGEATVLRNNLPDCRGQLYHFNNIISSPDHPIATYSPPLSTPSLTFSTSASSFPSSSLPIIPSSSHPSLSPVPYSSTISILECNFDLHRECFNRRVAASNSNLGIVAAYHHWLDITKILAPNHHNHHYP